MASCVCNLNIRCKKCYAATYAKANRDRINAYYREYRKLNWSVVREYDDQGKAVGIVTGSYRHSQTVNGETLAWKCAAMSITGVVKLVEDEYQGNKFYRMEGLAANAAAVTTVTGALAEVSTSGW